MVYTILVMSIFRKSILSLAYGLFVLLLLAPQVVGAQTAFEDPRSAAALAGGGSSLIAVEPKMDGGTVIVGSSSKIVALYRNDGAKPVNIGAISTYSSSGISASVHVNQCTGQPIDSGAVCAIVFNVKGLQPGVYRLEVLMPHDGRSKLLRSYIEGAVESTGDAVGDLVSDIESVPTEIAFESVTSSRPQVRSIVLRNVTSNKVDINEMYIEASPQSGFTLSTDCTALEAGQACLATVTWQPAQEGADSGVLVIRHNGPSAITSVPIDGTFTPVNPSEATIFPSAVPGKGLLVSSQTEIDFGGGVESASSITVSLVNVGDADLSLQDLRMASDENGVSIRTGGCRPGTILEPVEACALTLEWEPVRSGEIVDDIQIYHTGARGILVIPVRGAANQAVNKDSKAVVFNASMADEGLLRSIPKLSASDLGEDDGAVMRPAPPAKQDVSGVLDGFTVTSLAPNRAIIAGPGGSRVVFEGEEAVIGGVLWTVNIRSSSIVFTNGDQRVLLLFDKSLSSVNRVARQSTQETTTTEDN